MFRRLVFLVLGALEFSAAVVLCVFAWAMPGASEVHDGVSRVENMAAQTSAQAERLRDELRTLREQRPKLQEMAEKLRTQMEAATAPWKNPRIDGDAVQSVEDALGDVARGLDGLSELLDPDAVRRMASGFKGAADFLDDQVAPTASRAADQVDESAAALSADARELGQLLYSAPLDLKAARQVRDELSRFTEDLDSLDARLDPARLSALRDGFHGMGNALAGEADQVEERAGAAYVTLHLEGLKPVLDPQPFWPEGKKIAGELRQASRGASQAETDVRALGEELPRLRDSLKESRKAAETARGALNTALQHEDQVAMLLKNSPRRTAQLAEQLPKLGSDLSLLLRQTGRLQEASALLRGAQKSMESAAARWPELRRTLADSAQLLRATQDQLRTALARREDYQNAMNQVVLMARTYSEDLPRMTEQLGERLQEQEDSLQNLGDSIDAASAVLPEWDRGASRFLEMTRLLLYLMGAIFSLHGAYLMVGAWRRGRQAASVG